MPVQFVIRPMNDKYHDYRGYAGQIGFDLFATRDVACGAEPFDDLARFVGPRTVVVAQTHDRTDAITVRDDRFPHRAAVPAVRQAAGRRCP